MASDSQSSNPRPAASSSLPAVTLIVLVGIIVALLYIGYSYVRDDTDGADELTNVAIDSTSGQPLAQNEPEMLMPPVEADTSSQPVDLSQAEPPADAVVADPKADEVAADNRETIAGKPDEKPKAEKKLEAEKPKAEKPKEKEKVAEKPVQKPKVDKPISEETVTANLEKPTIKPGGVSRTYTVGQGETLYGVANRYNMKVSTLKAMNPGLSENDVKAGITKLNVKVMAVHTVGPGDVLRVVAQKYGVSKEAIMRANRKSKDIAQRGETLIIPYPEKQ